MKCPKHGELSKGEILYLTDRKETTQHCLLCAVEKVREMFLELKDKK